MWCSIVNLHCKAVGHPLDHCIIDIVVVVVSMATYKCHCCVNKMIERVGALTSKVDMILVIDELLGDLLA